MALRSKAFKDDPKLEACAVSDPAHIRQGAVGEHVGKIQTALITVDNAAIQSGEIAKKSYGPSTAAAVLSFKKKRNIINYNYQTQADDIVGRMTIVALDSEMCQHESPSDDPHTHAICVLPYYDFRVSRGGTKASAVRDGGGVAAPTPPTPKEIAKGDVHEVRQWILAARDWIWDARACVIDPTLEAKDPSRFTPRITACDTHFHFKAKPAGDQEGFLKSLKLNYDKMLDLTADPDKYFGDDLKVYPPGDKLLGAWAHAPIGGWDNGKKDEAKVWFRGIFAGVTGKKCRCAMIIHECAHSCCDGHHFANDWPLPNGAPDDPFGRGNGAADYGHLAPDDAKRNCTSYAAFAANARFGSDLRPGAHDLTT